MTAVIQVLLSILMSLGITFTTANVGDSIADVLEQQPPETKQYIERWLQDPAFMSTMTTIAMTNDMIEYATGGEVKEVSAEDLAREGINLGAWMAANAGNINRISQLDNGCFQLANGGTLRVETASQYEDGFKREGKHYTFIELNQYSVTGEYIQHTWFYDDISCEGSCTTQPVCWSTWGTTDGVLGYELVDAATDTYAMRFNYWSESLAGFYVKQLYFRPDGQVTGAGTTEADATIGEVTTDQGTFPLNPDGSVTINGVTYYPNADGSYSVNNNTYYPQIDLSAYNMDALMNLLEMIYQQLLDLENALEWEDDNTYEDAADVSLSYTGELSEFVYPTPKFMQVFPFCLPWDLVRGVKLLSSSPVAPKFVIPFEIPEFGMFKGYSSEIVLDFAQFDKYFHVVRWFSTVIFVAGLIFVTFKIVKGAN